jgi:tetratricopeptide (TPR) repeat protein
MRRLAWIALLAAAAAAEEGALTTDAARQLARVEAHLKRGRESLAAFEKAESNAQRLHALARARFHLEKADGIARARKEPEFAVARKEVAASLVAALVRQARVYYERKSLPKAKETVGLALKLDPSNAKAQALLDAILKAEAEDIYDPSQGRAVVDRLRARRMEGGIPLRDRGVPRNG